MSINRIIVIFTLFLMICIPMSICAFADDVVAQEDVAVVEGRNLFEEFYYRLFLKDTRDFYDYVMLGTFVVGLLIVMVFQNTHYYVVKKIEEGLYKKVLVIPTGALLSNTIMNQKETIPSIAHAYSLEVNEWVYYMLLFLVV